MWVNNKHLTKLNKQEEVEQHKLKSNGCHPSEQAEHTSQAQSFTLN